MELIKKNIEIILNTFKKNSFTYLRYLKKKKYMKYNKIECDNFDDICSKNK